MENLKNNRVTLGGTIAKEPEYSHEVIGEKFYIMNVAVNRTSENSDIIPVLVSDRAWDIASLALGEKVKVTGSYRSYNKPLKNKTKLLLYVLAEDIQEKESEEDKNSIELEGYICKQPVYRKTPLGREIADLLLAVNRSYGKSDYIPCILWGRNARYTERLEIGEKLEVSGRIQSREYNKKISETDRKSVV